MEKNEALPHLIYISREKRPDQPHHFKAGAMNVLTRVSGVMTNAPFMLNVDCDFFVNNPKVFRHALCFLYGFKDEKKSGFVHFPQVYYNGLKDDPFGCQMKILIKHLTHGMEAFQGPTYVGTGCFHRRKIIYGQSPPENTGLNENGISLELNALKRTFGEDELLLNSVVRTLSMEKEMDTSIDKTCLTDRLEAAKRVASCDYELNTQWGNEVGLVYGGAAEDVLTGFRIHSQGWHSVIYFPEPPAFLGCTPTSAPVTLVQHKRWATGLLEVLLRSRNPLHAIMKKRLLLGQYACYLSVLLWAVRSVPELCYAMLPTICIITNVSIFPEVNDPMFRLLAGLFIIHNFYTMMEYHLCGLSLREWWNNQRMLRIISCTSWLLGLVSAMMKSFGLSETIFELTKKDDTHDLEQDEDLGKFTFTSADIFVPATTLLFINMGGLIMSITKLVSGGEFKKVGELVCCVCLVLSFLPFLKGLFRRQPYGLPWLVILKSGILAFWFFYITSQFIK